MEEVLRKPISRRRVTTHKIEEETIEVNLSSIPTIVRPLEPQPPVYNPNKDVYYMSYKDKETYINTILQEYCKDKFIDDKTKISLDLKEYSPEEGNKIHWFFNIGTISMYNQIHRNFDLSCGHRSFTNLPYTRIIDSIKDLFKEEYKENALFDLYKIIFDFIKISCRCQFVLVSNNNYDSSMGINNILEKLARWKTGDDYLRNPNSGADIKMWIM